MRLVDEVFIGLSLSCDGIHFSRLHRLIGSRLALFGRAADQPPDGWVVEWEAVYFFVHHNVPGLSERPRERVNSHLTRYRMKMDDLRAYTRTARSTLKSCVAL